MYVGSSLQLIFLLELTHAYAIFETHGEHTMYTCGNDRQYYVEMIISITNAIHCRYVTNAR